MQVALQQDAVAASEPPMPTLKPCLGGPVAKGINWLLGLFEKKPGALLASQLPTVTALLPCWPTSARNADGSHKH